MNLSNPSAGPRPGLARAAAITLTLAALVACTGQVSQQHAAKTDHDGALEDRAQTGVLRQDQPLPVTPPATASSEVDEIMAAPPHVAHQAQEANAGARERVLATANRPQRKEQPLLNAAPPAIAAMHGYVGRHLAAPVESLDREIYAHVAQNGVKLAASEPVSTFSIDVDTGAYSNMRRFLNEGRWPPRDAVRVEELINYFSYGYAPPDTTTQPFSVSTELAATPWNPATMLLQIGIKGYTTPATERPASNLVFLIDVSGSMQSADKLPLLINAFTMLTNNLQARDRVAMVVYAGRSGVVLEPTAGDDRQRILNALQSLSAGGSTNGGAGIELAYRKARESFIDGGINRVILATDGDFNVGVANFERLLDMVERERTSGVSLTTLGFGTGNYHDQLMERLADAGNGNHAYIDGLGEARKVLVDELGATLQTIAKDVKIQVEFNPAAVAEYRLIGYENRALREQDFNNDKIDAGEIGAGHTVTAIYEITPVGSVAQLHDTRRYAPAVAARQATDDELAFVRLRYKAPAGDTSKLIELPVRRAELVAANDTSDDFRFAAAVAAFGQQLKGGQFTGTYRLDETAALARSALGTDAHGYRHEFVSLVRNAAALAPVATNQVSHSNAVAN